MSLTDENCPITKQLCFWARYNHPPCSNSPNIHDAANCIIALTAILGDREKEIGALDELVEKLQDKLAPDAGRSATAGDGQ